MKNLVLPLIVLLGSVAHAEIPLRSRDELTAREYVTCTNARVSVRLESISGRKELRTYEIVDYQLARVKIVDLETKQRLIWKLSEATAQNKGLKSSLIYKPTPYAVEELREEFGIFRARCELKTLLDTAVFNPKLQDLAVVMGTERERAHFYWH